MKAVGLVGDICCQGFEAEGVPFFDVIFSFQLQFDLRNSSAR